MRSELNVTHSKKVKGRSFRRPSDRLRQLMATAMSRRHVTRMLESGHVTGWSPGRWPGGCAFPWSRFRVGLSLVMWMASATPLRNQSVSWWRMETSFSENECLCWLRWWPTGEELRWCSETRLRRLLSVSPTYGASQSEHWIWYTTPARSSLGTLSLGCTRRLRMVL